jgi:hypothetical protein
MKAWLKPLDGKYYGSRIGLFCDDGTEAEINVWIHDSRYRPSRRELKHSGCVSVEEARDNDVTSDCHFESDTCHSVCLKIVNALNNKFK